MQLSDLILFILAAASAFGGWNVGRRATPALERKTLRILIIAVGAIALEVVTAVLIAKSSADYVRLILFYTLAFASIFAIFCLFLGISLMLRQRRRGGGLRIACMSLIPVPVILAGGLLRDHTALLFIPLLIFALPAAMFWRTTREPPDSDCCPKCGYNLTGANHKNCPECGVQIIKNTAA